MGKQASLEKHIGRATKVNAMYLRAQVRQYIKAGAPTAKGHVGVAPLTALVKGGDKPIVGTSGADLFNSITHEVTDWKTAVVGVKRGSKGANVALVVHDGVKIKVTKAMRDLFWLLFLVSEGHMKPEKLTGRARLLWDMSAKGRQKGDSFFPIRKSTKAIIIPSRPFLKDVFNNPEIKAKCVKTWSDAYKDMLKEPMNRG
jgi:hypothetical protein